MSAVENCADGYGKRTSARATLPALIIAVAARMAPDIRALAIRTYWVSMPADLFKVIDGLFVSLERLEKIEDVHGMHRFVDALPYARPIRMSSPKAYHSEKLRVTLPLRGRDAIRAVT